MLSSFATVVLAAVLAFALATSCSRLCSHLRLETDLLPTLTKRREVMWI